MDERKERTRCADGAWGIPDTAEIVGSVLAASAVAGFMAPYFDFSVCGRQSEPDSRSVNQNCRNCGAAERVAGKCKYCGSY